MYSELLVNGIDNFEKKIEDFASAIINAGLRFQKGWALAIECPTVSPDIARALTKEAYRQGARDVMISWYDPYIARFKYLNSEKKYLGNEVCWPDVAREKYGNKDIAYILIWSNNTDFYMGAPSDRQMLYNQNDARNFEAFKRDLQFPYVYTCAGSQEWGNKVFPDLSNDEAYIQIWKNIFDIFYIDGKIDPVEKWFKHCQHRKSIANKMNLFNFHHLHCTTGLGTDVTFELPENHKWIAAAVNVNPKGLVFSANMPTEEVFCVPKKFGVNGTVVCSRILVTKLGDVENLRMEVKDGKIVDYSADSGEEIIKTMTEADENFAYLGEIAIVPSDSPLCRHNLTYYHGVLDENCGCHTAIGNAYSKCIEGGLQMSSQQLEDAGLNVCKFHEDCIFGTEDINIVGVTYGGKEIPILKDGKFAI